MAAAAEEGSLHAGSAATAGESDRAQRCEWARAMVASPSPSHRVEGLEEAGSLESEGEREEAEAGRGRGDGGGGGGGGGELALRPRRQAALVLGYLERLGEPYGPPEVGKRSSEIR